MVQGHYRCFAKKQHRPGNYVTLRGTARLLVTRTWMQLATTDNETPSIKNSHDSTTSKETATNLLSQLNQRVLNAPLQ